MIEKNGKWLTAYDMADLIHEQEQKIADLETLLREAQCVISRTAQGDCISCKHRFGCDHSDNCEYVWEHEIKWR